MLYDPFNFQTNDNWDTDGLYWYNECYTKKPVWTGLNQFHGLQKTGPRWSGSVPAISGSVLDRLRSTVAHFGGKKPDWTGLANTSMIRIGMASRSKKVDKAITNSDVENRCQRSGQRTSWSFCILHVDATLENWRTYNDLWIKKTMLGWLFKIRWQVSFELQMIVREHRKIRYREEIP